MPSAPGSKPPRWTVLRNVTTLICTTLVLILPVAPLLPITINGLLYHNQLLPWLQQLTDTSLGCPGIPRWSEIKNDEVLNLGLRRPQFEAFFFFKDNNIISRNWDQAKTIGKVMHSIARTTHPDKNNDPGSNACHIAAQDAAKSLCHLEWGRAWDECRREAQRRGLAFYQHFKHSICLVERQEKDTDRAIAAEINAACNAKEWKMLERHGSVNWKTDLRMILDPEFMWKPAIYHFFQLRQRRVPVQGSCFWDGAFHTYTKLVDKEVPTRGPTTLQWTLIWGTVVYVSVVWHMWRHMAAQHAQGSVKSEIESTRRPSRSEAILPCDTDIKQPIVGPVVLTRRSRRLSCLPPEI